MHTNLIIQKQSTYFLEWSLIMNRYSFTIQRRNTIEIILGWTGKLHNPEEDYRLKLSRGRNRSQLNNPEEK